MERIQINQLIDWKNRKNRKPLILRGASPRATLSLTDMAKAAAYAAGKDYVTPQDIQNVFLPTLSHRIILSSESVSRHLNSEQVLKHILSKVRVPRI